MPRPDWYDAPECDTQEKGAPKFCKKSEPGEGTEQSCAFDDAQVVLMPVTDAEWQRIERMANVKSEV